MTSLQLEADKARLAHAILSIDNTSLLEEVKKHLNGLLNLNTATTPTTSRRTRKISKEVRDMVLGELPADIDVEKETDKMW